MFKGTQRLGGPNKIAVSKCSMLTRDKFRIVFPMEKRILGFLKDLWQVCVLRMQRCCIEQPKCPKSKSRLRGWGLTLVLIGKDRSMMAVSKNSDQQGPSEADQCRELWA